MYRWLCQTLSVLLVAGTIGPLVAFDDEVEPPPNAKEEIRRLAGTYRVIDYERDGVKSPAATLKTMKVILSKTGDDEFHSEGQVYTSKCQLCPNKKRGEVDSTYTNSIYNGKSIKGIYKIEGDKLICCYASPGQPRPTKFATTANSGLTVYTLQRTKEK